HEGVAVYDDGVQRATTTPDHTGSNAIEFSDSASMLYGYNNETSEFGFRRMTVDASGVSVDNVTNNLISNYNVDIEYDGGLVYATSGRVIEPEVLTILGTFAASGPVAPDSSVNRTFFLSGSTITAFNQTTFTSAGTLQVIGVSSGSGLIRWGDRGLALRTSTQIVIIETSLVAPKLTGTPTSTPPSGPTPSPTTEPPATPTAPQPTATPAVQTGDASCDGNVNSIDASLLLQVTAALVAALPCPEGADVNEDGVANALDAALILPYDAGLIDALPPA
ncbi:MAG: dockerin type I repeat-containing protein, partial [Dehalococcoidia bacterium]|nr:dockerin type I repeat-containing protein [Dehalococcoidia bacterium]